MRSLFQKIWDRHVVLRREGQCLLHVDRHIVHDGSFHAFANLARRGLKVRRPGQTFGTPDHYVPTASRSPADAPTVEIRRMVETFSGNVRAHGIPAFELTDERRVMACDEVGINAFLENPEPELLQARNLGLSKVCVSEVREGRTSPKSKRLGEQCGGEVFVTVRKRAPASIR